MANDSELEEFEFRARAEREAKQPVGAKPVAEEMSVGDSLKAGIAHSASKTVRGIGTTLLPKAAEQWMESKGLLPSERDVKMLDEMRSKSAAGQIAGTGMDIASELLPVSKAMKGAQTLKQALPRAAAVGGAIGGVRAEGEDVPLEAASGALGGVLGEGVGRTLVGGVSRLVKPSTEAKELMRRGITPTLGEAVDTSGRRVLGKALSAGEDWLTAMPITGMTTRTARRQSGQQLFNEAADLATAPGLTTPKGTPEEVIRQLRTTGSGAMANALNNSTVIAGTAQRSQMYKRIDDLAAKHGVSDDVVAQLKAELNQKLWNGIQQGQTTANVIENVAGDLFGGSYKALRGNTNAQRVANEVAGDMRNWVNTAAAQSGHDLGGVRQSLATTHALSRGMRGGMAEPTGERLMRGIHSNDAAMGASDTATRELRDLADLGGIIKGAQDPWTFRTPQQAIRGALGVGMEGASGFMAPALNAAGLAYGKLNQSEFAKRLLMGDPTAVAAARRALSPTATTIGIETATERGE